MESFYLFISRSFVKDLHNVSKDLINESRWKCLRTSLLASSTNGTTSICPTTTCVGKESSYRSSSITSLYTFDGNSNDWTTYGSGTGIGTSAPTYTAACYVGSQALNLASTSFQYVQISNIYLAQQSFTIEGWLYYSVGSVANEFGVFSQCDINLKCLLISIRYARITVSFDSMNTNSTLMGSTMLGTTQWTHFAVVYDATSKVLEIFYNGVLDAIATNVVAYQGSSSQITTIGKTMSSAYGTTYFNG